jgi:hypothetical protein
MCLEYSRPRVGGQGLGGRVMTFWPDVQGILRRTGPILNAQGDVGAGGCGFRPRGIVCRWVRYV